MRLAVFIVSLFILILLVRQVFYAPVKRPVEPLKKKVVIPAPKIKKEKKAVVPKGAVAEKPRVTPTKKGPEIAIVLDDFGYTMENVDKLLALRIPITFSILPHLAHSRDIAVTVMDAGYESILHLPMEPLSHTVPVEHDTITTAMTDAEIVAIVRSASAAVPGINGVSNHMGSRATQDRRIMTIVMRYLKTRGLFFFDSRSTGTSVCEDVAYKVGLPFAARDIFLDNSNDPDYIKNQLLVLKKRALTSGSAIGIGHDRAQTVRVLTYMLPRFKKEGIRFVFLSEEVN